MAVQDFQHFRAPDGVPDMQSFPVTASQSFMAGEPVVLIAAGTLSECSDDPSAITGIAAHRSTDVDGVTVDISCPGQVFKTNNFSTTSGTAATPALTNIGDLAGLDFSNGTDWFLDTSQDNLLCRIVGVRDAMGNDLGDPRVLPGTGVWVLFTFL
jgi:hypothetical protein